MEIELGDNLYKVEIVRKNNKNTYIRVKNGLIIVTTNYFVSDNKIKKLIRDNEKSIISMINKDINKTNKELSFYLFGSKYDIVYGFNDIDISNDKIYVKDKKMLNKYLDNRIKDTFKDRLFYWYDIFEEDIPIPNLVIRKMTSRWGVCNIKNHNVTLNYNLYKYDITCLDYVIVHELSHFIHPNHSKSFWLLVGKYYPRYKDARKMLKE